MFISIFLKNLCKKLLSRRIDKLTEKSNKYIQLFDSYTEKAKHFRVFCCLRSKRSKRYSTCLSNRIYDDLEKIQAYEDKAHSFYKKYLKNQSKIEFLEKKLNKL